MTEKEERLARDRAEIAARVASFRETQQKFEREREEYYETTLSNALNGSGRPCGPENRGSVCLTYGSVDSGCSDLPSAMIVGIWAEGT